jgi:hypothetical protein
MWDESTYILRYVRMRELGKHMSPILKNQLIAGRYTDGATQKRRGDSMYRKSESMILLALVAIATVAGIMTQTYAASNNSTVLSSSTTLSTLSISSTQNNSTCRLPPPRMGNETGAPRTPPTQLPNNSTTNTSRPPPPTIANSTDTTRPSPPWMVNLTAQQKQTLNKTVTKMKTSGATQEQIMNAVDALLKQWGIEIPQCP